MLTNIFKQLKQCHPERSWIFYPTKSKDLYTQLMFKDPSIPFLVPRHFTQDDKSVSVIPKSQVNSLYLKTKIIFKIQLIDKTFVILSGNCVILSERRLFL